MNKYTKCIVLAMLMLIREAYANDRNQERNKWSKLRTSGSERLKHAEFENCGIKIDNCAQTNTFWEHVS